jgi:hypothetical protein
LLAGFFTTATAADINVAGSWSKLVNRTDLIDGAGTDLLTPVESPPAVATLDITGFEEEALWTVTVVMNEVSWPPGTSVAVRRSSNDSGVSGGSSYLPVDGNSRIFFSGSGDRLGIQIQIKVDGIDIHTAPAIYSLAITYSVQPQ